MAHINFDAFTTDAPAAPAASKGKVVDCVHRYTTAIYKNVTGDIPTIGASIKFADTSVICVDVCDSEDVNPETGRPYLHFEWAIFEDGMVAQFNDGTFVVTPKYPEERDGMSVQGILRNRAITCDWTCAPVQA